MVQLVSGKRIKELLAQKGLKVMDVAAYFNLHPSTVNRYFNDQLKMSAEMLY